jgi:gas vesicle protein
VLPGVGLVDPNVPPAPAEETLPMAEDVPVAENVVYDEPVENASEAAYAPELEAPEAPAGGAEDFLSPPVEAGEPMGQSGRPPELRAAPADLKEIAPRRLGPPPGWDSAGEVPPMETERAQVAPETVWEETVEPAADIPQAEGYYAEGYAEPSEQQYEPQYEPEYEEQPAEEAAPVPMAVPMRQRVPTPLTSPHADRPATRRVTQQVRPSTGQTTRLQAGLPAPHGHTTQSIHTRHGPLPVAAQRLIPSWVLVVIGFLLGAIAALVAAVKSPLRDKIGLMERTQANAYVLAVLKEERSQVQAMLDEYHRNAKIVITDDMAEFRAEMGRKAPERMTMQEFSTEIKEQEALKKEEEQEDKQAAEEEAKAAEEKNAAGEEKKE